jgi:hypothetical protein
VFMPKAHVYYVSVAAGFTIPPLGLRSSATSDVPPCTPATSQLSEGEDHVWFMVISEIFAPRGPVQVGEVSVGACGLQTVARLRAFFAGALDSLRRFFDPGLPDSDLVFAVTVADDVRADAPIVVLEGCEQDGVIHVVVAGEGGGEPDRHLFEGEVRVGVVGGGEEVSCGRRGIPALLSPPHGGSRFPCTNLMYRGSIWFPSSFGM